ncbi:hypothetical protein L1987_17988 [Smallanthus sonchifolius]|uniref:Uncharacterized protein n=1 Tax=Smallanthus sonchifolius TaxID=185202 RepID=A0ACB9J000_9ASTR|nr:hypothetical protein L1987_17988 [Smallanthus sonchifolius]
MTEEEVIEEIGRKKDVGVYNFGGLEREGEKGNEGATTTSEKENLEEEMRVIVDAINGNFNAETNDLFGLDEILGLASNNDYIIKPNDNQFVPNPSMVNTHLIQISTMVFPLTITQLSRATLIRKESSIKGSKN